MQMPSQIDVGNVRTRTEPQFNVHWPVIGAFMIVKSRNDDTIHFRDQDGNFFQVRDFDFLLSHATEREGHYQYPRPFVYDSDGTMIRQGEIGLVVFRNGNANLPVWLGALRPGNWTDGDMLHGFNHGAYERVAERRETSSYIYERMVDPDGDSSEQTICSEDMGESLDYDERKKKLKKVTTRTSSSTLQGTRLVRSVGFDERRIKPAGDISSMVPNGDYLSVRHWGKDDEGADERVLTGQFSVQLTDDNQLVIDLDSLLQGITEKAEKLVGQGNVRVTVMGSNPQGERPNTQSPKNGNVQLKYNGDLSILNDVQKVDGT
ncbi:MAG: hypothetical protein GF331_05925, partial [Chitinivibrionales bacterium]|nr:hypothetical protein [Chitinivibrionales bacterium]